MLKTVILNVGSFKKGPYAIVPVTYFGHFIYKNDVQDILPTIVPLNFNDTEKVKFRTFVTAIINGKNLSRMLEYSTKLGTYYYYRGLVTEGKNILMVVAKQYKEPKGVTDPLEYYGMVYLMPPYFVSYNLCAKFLKYWGTQSITLRKGKIVMVGNYEFSKVVYTKLVNTLDYGVLRKMSEIYEKIFKEELENYEN